MTAADAGRSAVTTHVLDAVTGLPAAGLVVRLSRDGPGGQALATGSTDADGRIARLGPGQLDAGEYRLTFDTGAWFERLGRPSFYPRVSIVFSVDGASGHVHVPLLLSPFAYSTYRGS
jgi:5-hydroxyisourate hydrolase